MQKTKPNLVIIHSFPTNSRVLKGFYDFLSDWSTVYPIDLPGFIKELKPLKNIGLENYALYVEEEIEKLGLANYWLGGVSFGFVIANLVKDKEHCKGILAIQPYLGTSSLNFSFGEKALFVFVIYILRFCNAFYRSWHSPFFQKWFLFRNNTVVNEKVKEYLKEIDARTFFETARLLLVNKYHGCLLKNCPYVLIINKDDNSSILSDKVINKFQNEAQTLLITPTTVDHFPDDMSKEYFKDNMKCEDIEKILTFMKKYDQSLN